MRDLKINPTDYELQVKVDELSGDGGYAGVSIKANSSEVTFGVSASEARQLSKWFAALGKEIDKAEKAYARKAKKVVSK